MPLDVDTVWKNLISFSPQFLLSLIGLHPFDSAINDLKISYVNSINKVEKSFSPIGCAINDKSYRIIVVRQRHLLDGFPTTPKLDKVFKKYK